MRLTKSVVQQILNQNEGFQRSTSYSSRNSSESRRYTITSGALHIRATGKTSWSDSRYDEESVADEDQTRRFLREHIDELDTSGIK